MQFTQYSLAGMLSLIQQLFYIQMLEGAAVIKHASINHSHHNIAAAAGINKVVQLIMARAHIKDVYKRQAEAMMIELGHKIGRMAAHEVVYESAMKSYEQERDLADCLLEDPRVTSCLLYTSA